MRAFGKKRRGRPPGEKRPTQDEGTPEQQARKKVMVGNADPKYSEYPLGVLFARRIITQDQHDAGCRYAYLHGRVFGRGGAKQAGDNWSGEEVDEVMAVIEKKLRETGDFLMSQGHVIKNAVDNAAIHGIWPMAEILKPDESEGYLAQGLQALVDFQKRG